MTVLKPKKIISLLLTACMTLALISTSLCTTASAASKTVIKSVDDLKNISKDLSGTYELGANINCKGASVSPIGNLAKPFTGTFTCPTGANGKPTYAITNLTINVKIGGDRKSQQSQYKANGDTNWCVGLFGAAKDANFQNIVVLNANINSDVLGGSDTGLSYSEIYNGMDEQGTGIMCGVAVGTTFKNCGVQGTVTSASNSVGGFIGQARRTINSSGNGNKPLMSGKSGTTVQNCYAYVNVNATGTFQWNSGGFVGAASNSIFTGSFFDGTLAVTTGTSMAAGGFIGCINYSTFKACYATGSFTQGGYNPGAFAGQYSGHNAAADRCEQCYSNIKMSGTPFAAEANDKSGNFITPNVGGKQEGFAVKSIADINAKFASNALWNTYNDGATLPTVKALTGKTVKTLADLGVDGDDTEGVSGDCVWRIENTHLIINGNGRMGESTWNRRRITSVTIEGNVTHISESAFSGCRELTSIYIPDSVTSIGWDAFSNCTSLTSVTIGSGVTNIDYSAFYGCTNLKDVYYTGNLSDWCNIKFYDYYSNPMCYAANLYINGKPLEGEITIPDSATSIVDYAFIGCAGITSISIPDSVASIGQAAFSGCTRLTSATLGNSITNIGEEAFSGCENLVTITIPDSVTNIGDDAFKLCKIKELIIVDGSKTITPTMVVCEDTLENVTIPGSVTSIGSSAFSGCKNLRTIDIPDSVVEIGDDAFRNCTALTSVTLPDSLRAIGSSAFSGCTNLSGINIPERVKDIGNSAFSECTNLTEIKVDKNNKKYCSVDGVLYNKDKTGLISFPAGKAGDFIIPDGVTSIGNKAFYVCKGLTSVTIGNGVTNIGIGAFWGCTGLTSITIPDSVTSMGDVAFSSCTGLTSVTIGNGVTSIGRAAFWGCTGLISVSISDSVTSIYRDAFNFCKINELIIADGSKTVTSEMVICKDTLEKVTIPDSVTDIGDGAFWRCENLATITIPDSVTSIGDRAFYGCKGLTSVTIGNGVTNIGWDAFNSCGGLTSITIPDSVTSIESGAFSGCTGLVNVTIPDSVTNIESDTFYACKRLTSVTIGNGVTNIGSSAFNGCSGLMSITIPDSVTSIGNSAFDGCKGLTSVTIGNGVTSIGNKSFAGCKNLRTIVIPESVTKIADDAFNESYLVTIKTTENSAAHKYALENDIDFELIVTVKSNDKNITISTDNSVIPSAGVSLSTEKVENIGEKYEAQLKNLGAEKFTAYNIDLMKDGAKIQPNGKVAVSVAVPDGMDGAKCKVYRAETDGTLTDMGAVFENGKLTFITDHFSLYIIAQFAVKPGDVTGDGVVNSGDAIEVLRHDAKAVTLTNAQLAAANVDGNDRIDSNDSILILQYDAKAIDKFPIG